MNLTLDVAEDLTFYKMCHKFKTHINHAFLQLMNRLFDRSQWAESNHLTDVRFDLILMKILKIECLTSTRYLSM